MLITRLGFFFFLKIDLHFFICTVNVIFLRKFNKIHQRQLSQLAAHLLATNMFQLHFTVLPVFN